MSNNYRLYPLKDIQRQVTRKLDRSPLREQLDELMEVVQRCEAMWAIEERIEGSLG
jgi:hypothetical protein